MVIEMHFGLLNISKKVLQHRVAVTLATTTCTILLATGIAIGSDTETILGIEADTEYGEYLAGECITCHNADQALGEKGEGGVPGIHGAKAESIITNLLLYKSGVRDNTTMKAVVQTKADDEIAALAAYFASFASDASQSQDSDNEQTTNEAQETETAISEAKKTQ